MQLYILDFCLHINTKVDNKTVPIKIYTACIVLYKNCRVFHCRQNEWYLTERTYTIITQTGTCFQLVISRT